MTLMQMAFLRRTVVPDARPAGIEQGVCGLCTESAGLASAAGAERGTSEHDESDGQPCGIPSSGHRSSFESLGRDARNAYTALEARTGSDPSGYDIRHEHQDSEHRSLPRLDFRSGHRPVAEGAEKPIGSPSRPAVTAGRWAYPGAAVRVPEFVSTLLSAVRRNERYWVYPDRGVWSPGRDIESEPQARVWMATVRALGLPAGLRGAVGFNSTDWNELLSMLFLQVTLGPQVRIDATVIPENGSAVLRFEQNRSVWGAFKDPASFRAVVEAMERAGYSPQSG